MLGGAFLLTTAAVYYLMIAAWLTALLALGLITWLRVAIGLVALAVGVNFIELLCSAGVPAVYTQVLAMTPMPAWQHYAWLGLYVLVFLADDLAIFVGAMLTLELTGGTGRYAHHAQLIGGVVLLGVGALLVLRPQWLLFG